MHRNGRCSDDNLVVHSEVALENRKSTSALSKRNEKALVGSDFIISIEDAAAQR